MGRKPCCDKTKVKRGSWSPQEDDTLKNYIHKHGTPGNWIALPQKAGLERCGKSCRLRWLNYLRPNIKHGGFTTDEEFIISNLFNQIGSRWSIIASHLPGRTDNEVKNYWNTKLKKKHMPQLQKASQIVPTTNLEAFQDCYFPMSFEPINFSYQSFNMLEGSRDYNTNFPFSPSLQDSSQFSPFCIGMDESIGVKREEYSCDGIWSKEECEAIESDCNADLFSF